MSERRNGHWLCIVVSNDHEPEFRRHSELTGVPQRIYEGCLRGILRWEDAYHDLSYLPTGRERHEAELLFGG